MAPTFCMAHRGRPADRMLLRVRLRLLRRGSSFGSALVADASKIHRNRDEGPLPSDADASVEWGLVPHGGACGDPASKEPGDEQTGYFVRLLSVVEEAP